MCVEHFAPPRILWIFALDDRRRFILLYFVLPVPTQFPHLRNHSCCTYRVEGCWRVFLMRRSLAPDDVCAGKGVFGGGLLCPALPCRFLSFALAYFASIHFAASENLRCVIYGTFSCFPPCLFYPPPPQTSTQEEAAAAPYQLQSRKLPPLSLFQPCSLKIPWTTSGRRWNTRTRTRPRSSRTRGTSCW